MPHDQESYIAALAHLRETRERLEILIPRLRQASERCAESSRPLANLDKLDGPRKKELADNIRAANRQWEEVTSRIDEVFAILESLQHNVPPAPA